MCGRAKLPNDVSEIKLDLKIDLDEIGDYRPRWNAAPTSKLPVVISDNARRVLTLMRWGLVPSWAASLAGGAKMINARAETIATKPAFRDAFARRRCLVPADGFYEWRPGDPTKQPYRISARDGAPLAFAGLWERWSPPRAEGGIESGESESAGKASHIDSFTIVTTVANAALTPLHHRMPVVLTPASRDAWLDPAAEPADLLALLRPADDDLLHYFPVDRRVNSVRNDDAALLAPATA